MRMTAGRKGDRRVSGLLRVPFVRLCHLDFPDGRQTDAFIVNINILGAYVAADEMPDSTQLLRCRFQLPGNERELSIGAGVAWINRKQQHPVHSLPAGFGIAFRDITPEDQKRIEDVVLDYAARNPGVAR